MVGIRTSPTPSEGSTATATGSDDKQKISEEEENQQSEVEEKGDGNDTPVKEEEGEKESPTHPIQATEGDNTTESEHTSNSPVSVINYYIVPEQVEKEDGLIEIVLTPKQVKEEMIKEEEEWVNLSMSDYPHQQSSLHQSTCQLPS